MIFISVFKIVGFLYTLDPTILKSPFFLLSIFSMMSFTIGDPLHLGVPFPSDINLDSSKNNISQMNSDPSGSSYLITFSDR